MRVRCLYNTGAFLPQNMIFKGSRCQKTDSYPITVGKNYIVYAITIFDGYPWYSIFDEQIAEYPQWIPSPLFAVEDNRLSKYWVYCQQKGIHYEFPTSTFAFPEWAEDPDFSEKIRSRFELEVKLFSNYRALMDLELPDDSVKAIAQIADPEWLICPLCVDAWQSVSTDGMIVCSNCKAVMHNPRFQPLPNDLKGWMRVKSASKL